MDTEVLYILRYYETEDDPPKNPYKKWGNKQIPRARNRVSKVITKALRGGLNPCDNKPYQSTDIWELRCHDGPGYRVFYRLTGEKMREIDEDGNEFGSEKNVFLVLDVCIKRDQDSTAKRADGYWLKYKRRQKID